MSFELKARVRGHLSIEEEGVTRVPITLESGKFMGGPELIEFKDPENGGSEEDLEGFLDIPFEYPILGVKSIDYSIEDADKGEKPLHKVVFNGESSSLIVNRREYGQPVVRDRDFVQVYPVPKLKTKETKT